MGICWWCHWGWPKPILDIYKKALVALGNDEMPLHYGPAHIVWEDENFDSAGWCLDNFDESAARTDYTEYELDIVRQSLIELLALPDEYKSEPAGYAEDDDHPEKYPPPDHWEMSR